MNQLLSSKFVHDGFFLHNLIENDLVTVDIFPIDVYFSSRVTSMHYRFSLDSSYDFEYKTVSNYVIFQN